MRAWPQRRVSKPISRPSPPSFRRPLIALALAGLLLAACGKKPPEAGLTLEPVAFNEIPGWQTDDMTAALPALTRSCGRLAGQPDDRPVGPGGGGLAGTVADWQPVCGALARVPAGDDAALRRALEDLFTPFRTLGDGRDHGTFTGYYEAELDGALFPGAGYDVPLYRRPPDLVTVDLGRFRADLAGARIVGRVADGALVPYYTRAEIDGGALDGRNLELLWAKDPVDVFFLHVQGSGVVHLPDGSERRVGFAATNGRDFYAIGRALLDEGRIPRDRASMQAIRDWLRGHPAKAAEVMQRNARYVFFRWIEGDGPIGSQGVALTPGRSLAVDPAFLPLGVPVFLDTTWPGSDRPLRRLMVAQDTGGAIKGPIRGDVFWGAGEAALAQAGRMKQDGRLYLLLPKAVAARRTAGS